MNADLLVTGAVVHTLDPQRPRAEAFAASDGVIVEVGDAADLARLAGPGTEVVDLGGAVVLPGLIDVHTHHAMAGEADLHRLQVPPTASVPEILRAVRARAATLPSDAWIVGGTWGQGLIAELSASGTLAALDDAALGHPVLLTDDSHHNKWANTLAMRRGGVLDLPGDPGGGRVVRDADGAPTGLLFESAGALVERARVAGLELDTAYHARNSERGIELLHKHGITAFQDAAVSLDTMAGLRLLDEEGRLRAWVVTSMLVNDFVIGAEVVGEPLLSQGERFRTRHHRPDFAKIFLDGIPTTWTGAFIDPYLPDEDHGACFRGHTTMPIEVLGRWLSRAAELGIGLKVHCTGDASVRMVLDVLEQARDHGGGLPPVQIAHGQYVHPDDIARFAELGAVADMSPPLWFPGVIVAALHTVRPQPQAGHIHPARSLLDAGALIAGGSDWPVAESPDPWQAIAGLVTRQDPTGRFPGSVWPEQAITVSEAIAAYTTGSARAVGLQDVIGRLRPGLSADFVVLDHDPFAVPAQELGAVTTRQTWFAGQQVYRV